MEKVVIESFGDGFYLYNEAGQVMDDPEPFDSYEEAEQYAQDNGYEVVYSFHV